MLNLSTERSNLGFLSSCVNIHMISPHVESVHPGYFSLFQHIMGVKPKDVNYFPCATWPLSHPPRVRLKLYHLSDTILQPWVSKSIIGPGSQRTCITYHKVFWELWLILSMIQLICTGTSSSSSLPLLLVFWPLTYSLLTPILTWTYSWFNWHCFKIFAEPHLSGFLVFRATDIWLQSLYIFGEPPGSDLNNICPLSSTLLKIYMMLYFTRAYLPLHQKICWGN